MAETIHKARTFEEVRADRYIDRGDYAACPPKECRNGSFHARWSLDWAAVDCPRCLERKPANG